MRTSRQTPTPRANVLLAQTPPVVISSRPGLALSLSRVRPNWYGPAPSVVNSFSGVALGVGVFDGRVVGLFVPFVAGVLPVAATGGGGDVGELQPAAPSAAAIPM